MVKTINQSPTLTSQKQRFDYIDIARGIAIITVIFGHIFYYSSDPMKWIYSFHMPLFFFISGLCFSPKKYTLWQFIKKKAKRLLSCYVILTAITWILCLLYKDRNYALSLEFLYDFVFRGIPRGYFFGFWFITAMFVIEIVCFLAYKLISLAPKYEIFGCLVFIALFALLSAKFTDTYNGFLNSHITFFNRIYAFFHNGTELKTFTGNVMMPWSLHAVIPGCAFFFGGFLLKRIIPLIKRYQMPLFAFFLMISLALAYANADRYSQVNVYNSKIFNPILFYICAFSGIFTILILSMRINKSEILQYFGQ
jgi:fucose 4-O-acetylase-like acetyltransferase